MLVWEVGGMPRLNDDGLEVKVAIAILVVLVVKGNCLVLVVGEAAAERRG